MVDYNAALLLCRNTIALLCAVSINVSPAAYQESHILDAGAGRQFIKEGSLRTRFARSRSDGLRDRSSVARNDGPQNFDKEAINTDLWQYLRRGINYLEASGKEVPLDYKHPGGKAYGPLALTPIAIKDVGLHYPSLSRYTLDNVLSDASLYEKFAYLYAKLLLNHYIKADHPHMPKREVFDILQKAWFLGPTLYKKGHFVIASRKTRAKEFMGLPFPLTAHTI